MNFRTNLEMSADVRGQRDCLKLTPNRKGLTQNGIQSLMFGVAGMELGYYLIEIYDGTDDTFKKVVADLTHDLLPPYSLHFSHEVSSAIQSDNFDQQAENGTPAKMMVACLEMHNDYIRKVGLADDLFIASYIKYIRQIPGEHGASEVVKLYQKDPKMTTADL